MHIEGPGPILSCDHGTHTDEQLTECLALQWGMTVPQLVALLAGIVFSHTERAATQDDDHAGVAPMLFDFPARSCEWCHRALPGGTHHSRRYCPGADCKRLSYNAWQRAGRPSRKSTP